jgi:hypothetical protein
MAYYAHDRDIRDVGLMSAKEDAEYKKYLAAKKYKKYWADLAAKKSTAAYYAHHRDIRDIGLMSAKDAHSVNRQGGVRSLSRSHEYPRRPIYRSPSHRKAAHYETEVRAAAYLHKATGKGWFVGPHGALYVSIPNGFTAHDVYSKVSHLPELRELKHYRDKLYLAPAATRRLGERLHLHASTLREYCRKVGGPHEHRFFGKSYGCDPWLTSHLSRTGGAGLKSMLRNLGIRTGVKTGGSRLKRIHHPLMRTNRKRKAPAESATDFTIGTVRPGQDGYLWKVIKTSRTRRWKSLKLKAGGKGEQGENETPQRGGNGMCQHVLIKPNPHHLPLGFCVCLRKHGVLTCYRVAGSRVHKHWVPVQNI